MLVTTIARSSISPPRFLDSTWYCETTQPIHLFYVGCPSQWLITISAHGISTPPKVTIRYGLLRLLQRRIRHSHHHRCSRRLCTSTMLYHPDAGYVFRENIHPFGALHPTHRSIGCQRLGLLLVYAKRVFVFPKHIAGMRVIALALAPQGNQHHDY